MRSGLALAFAVLLAGPGLPVQAAEQEIPAAAAVGLLQEDALRAESARAYCGMLMLAKRNGFSYAPAAMEKGFARAFGELLAERTDQGFAIMPSTLVTAPLTLSLPSQ